MFGDICPTCNTTTPCGCETETEESPCLPGPANAECDEWQSAYCVFWMGDPIPGTPIQKRTRMTEIIFHLLDRIKQLEADVLELQTP
jgi:hypothetical protein